MLPLHLVVMISIVSVHCLPSFLVRLTHVQKAPDQ